ncbi:hypothetical protein [Ketogulonicigenium vulgare]|uniref:hypothetical protein n=1 Tax=Ketogulonicigenium vulgare TaxID=92945 RepID=UPI002359F5D9|nr:hypothetical protein [Ketogulonicigenium vulgare]
MLGRTQKVGILAGMLTVAAVMGLAMANEPQRSSGNRTMADIMETAQRSLRAQECRAVVNAWDSGNRRPAIQKYGSVAEFGVQVCRNIVELDDYDRSINANR